MYTLSEKRTGFKDIPIRVTKELKVAIEDRARSLGISVPEFFRLIVFLEIRHPRHLKLDKGLSTKEGALIKIGFGLNLARQVEYMAKSKNLKRSRLLRSLAIRELEEFTDFEE